MLNTMNQIVPGSIADVAKTTGKSIAQTFMHAKVVTIVDVSGIYGHARLHRRAKPLLSSV